MAKAEPREQRDRSFDDIGHRSVSVAAVQFSQICGPGERIESILEPWSEAEDRRWNGRAMIVEQRPGTRPSQPQAIGRSALASPR